jgi:hypothetical protein
MAPSLQLVGGSESGRSELRRLALGKKQKLSSQAKADPAPGSKADGAAAYPKATATAVATSLPTTTVASTAAASKAAAAASAAFAAFQRVAT